MSAQFKCDRCGKKGGTFDGYSWVPPKDWPPSFVLDDWEVHGCTQQHLDEVLESRGVSSPKSTTGIKLDTPPRPLPRPRPDDSP